MPGLTTRALILAALLVGSASAGAPVSPYDADVAEQLAKLGSESVTDRAAAAEALGFLRAYRAAGALTKALRDDSPAVRREAAMALAWCGGRGDVPALLAALGDADWTVRQGAWVSLTNLTGMEFPFDANASEAVQARQAAAWRAWWAEVPPDRAPQDVLDLLPPAAHETPATARIPKPATPPKSTKTAPAGKNLARGCAVSASSVYKGPPKAVTDGSVDRGRFWQTKNVKLPQSCTIDLGQARQVGCVVVYQYDDGFCMTDYELATSVDGAAWQPVHRREGRTPVRLAVTFEPRVARFVRITSYATVNRTYPTTFLEVQVTADVPPRAVKLAPPPASRAPDLRASEEDMLRWERGVRALGVLGGPRAAGMAAAVLAPYAQARRGCGSPAERSMGCAAIRALGRLGGPEALKTLTKLLANTEWARYAADAVADCGGEGAAAALIAAYPDYAESPSGKRPRLVPRDDRPGLDPGDRMYETPYAIAAALARLPLSRQEDVDALGQIVPLLMASLPTDWDGILLYEPEAYQRVTAWLLDRAGWRDATCRAALRALGQAPDGNETEQEKALSAIARRNDGDVPQAGAFLAGLCRHKEHAPALIALLSHPRGWARMYAAKALMLMGERSAAEPIAKALREAKSEADYGYCGEYLYGSRSEGQDEYDDPTPRWREAFVRALGRLGTPEHAPLLAKILEDEGSALEVRCAAAHALDALGGPEAMAALRRAEAKHPYHSIRLVAREALWRRGLLTPRTPAAYSRREVPRESPSASPSEPTAVVFIKGPNQMPNLTQIDPWRQTYIVTDPGPTHRLGTNLHLLRPMTPDGKVTPLTSFTDGYVADCEVSWDGRRVVFARRGGDGAPWWHIWEVGLDGQGLRQITRGPYHDVQPVYLPDGRIAFSSTRIGARDEYHGYLCTGLTVMNADGSDIHCVGFNFGRDNEPAILADGRILFSRLELFYSRLKTELTVQTAFPDGTHNTTLYGPERRMFWSQVSRSSGERGWGEVAPRHRVLRLTQGQPADDGRILCTTTGGLALLGPGRLNETFVGHDKAMAVTTPFPLGDGRILCAATAKTPGPARVMVRSRRRTARPDLGLYLMEARTGAMTLLYNDPATAEFEARPIRTTPRPPVLAESPDSRGNGFTGSLFCNSARFSQEPRVGRRGKLVRVVEGLPPVTRHHTQKSAAGPAWKNHAGTLARVLGTVPLAADGSFAVDVPADRMIHLQVLDSDRRVVGNQLIWMYVRPGETKGCVGCHEPPDSTGPTRAQSLAARRTPVPCVPTGGEFSYRAKAWNKGRLPDEAEERTRTVRAVNLVGR
jgi:HEAT repeat protein